MKKQSNPRFEKVFTDPKFKEIPKKVQKVLINDNRFKKMFHDEKFNSKLDYDEYGRKVKPGQKNIELEKYYTLEEDIKDEKIENDEINLQNTEQKENENEDQHSSDTSEEFAEFLQNYHQEEDDDTQSQQQENIPTGEETERLSIMNLDWENIHALDLFILLSSFCTGKSQVKKVEIYPSEFGKGEMEKQREEGPDREIFKNEAGENDEESEGNEDEENSEGFNPIELRKFELKKLKYYYAVVYCDSKETAMKLYTECDGMEIERTQSFMDIRFIPHSIQEFPYPPVEVCDHIPHDYEYTPKFKLNPALQHTKVKLTWDSTDPKREELINRAFSKEQFREDEIQELLMSSDSDVISEEEVPKENEDIEDLNKFALLKRKRGKQLKIKEGETIEIKFNKGFEGVTDQVGESKTSKTDKSAWEAFKEKKKNIRREKKMEEKSRRDKIRNQKKGIVEDSRNINTNENNQKKKTNIKELDLLVDTSIKNKSFFKYNPEDERFTAIKRDRRFAIDPTSKEYKKIKK